jgi:TolA-binding protein
MADTPKQAGSLPSVDVSTITDPDIRRVVRQVVQLNQQLSAQIRQQQNEIEALLQMMIEKHVGSIGEFKRHMLKLQQGGARNERLHEQITSATQVGLAAAATGADQKPAATPATPAPRPTRPEKYPEFAEPEVDRPRRYTL